MVQGSSEFCDPSSESLGKDKYFTSDYFQARRLPVGHANEHQTEDPARAAAQAAIGTYWNWESGGSFAEVAERWSDCKGSGGDLGSFPGGRMVKEFEDVLRDLNLGDRSGIFVTPFGFHIAELRAKQAEGVARAAGRGPDKCRTVGRSAESGNLVLDLPTRRRRSSCTVRRNAKCTRGLSGGHRRRSQRTERRRLWHSGLLPRGRLSPRHSYRPPVRRTSPFVVFA
jgi:hypothetical protein